MGCYSYVYLLHLCVPPLLENYTGGKQPEQPLHVVSITAFWLCAPLASGLMYSRQSCLGMSCLTMWMGNPTSSYSANTRQFDTCSVWP